MKDENAATMPCGPRLSNDCPHAPSASNSTTRPPMCDCCAICSCRGRSFRGARRGRKDQDNDLQMPLELVVGHYARRWRVENGIAEAAKFFHNMARNHSSRGFPYRPRCDRGLDFALAAMIQPPLRNPRLPMATAWTTEPFRPPQLG